MTEIREDEGCLEEVSIKTTAPNFLQISEDLPGHYSLGRLLIYSVVTGLRIT